MFDWFLVVLSCHSIEKRIIVDLTLPIVVSHRDLTLSIVVSHHDYTLSMLIQPNTANMLIIAKRPKLLFNKLLVV